MSKLPTVAIIGRPNTGKSTLFNRLVGRRKAIVTDVPGTTRDHIAHRIETEEVDYLLIDTGGMGGGTEDFDLEDDVEQQSILALEHADVILMTINSREDLTSADFSIVDTLRKKRKGHVPVILIATKCDNPENVDQLLPQYYELGIADAVVAISAPHNFGIDQLQIEVISALQGLHFSKDPDQGSISDLPKIAMIGKPNAGKSSLINAFMSEGQREKSGLLVSDIPGTTRDATDTVIKYHDNEYLFIDTAGVKRRKQTEGEIETFSYFRSVAALEFCDVCVLILDGQEPVTKQDKRIAGMAIEAGKALIIVVNKSDLLDKEQKELAKQYITYELAFCKFAPVLFTSAEKRDGLLKIFDLIESASHNRKRRISTSDLVRWFRDAVADQPMAALSSAKLITQAEEIPPTFILFVKSPKRVQPSQLRYLENSLRRTFAFEGSPVRWILK
ncbi:MAG: ribosome biogenesis GTPase Der [bacterium]|nr:ribosome biogenesis GTPase Der [bacterium]